MKRIYPAKLVEVRGTDTIEVDVDLGFNMFTKQKVRLFGVKTAGKDAEVRTVLLDLCSGGLIIEPIITKRAKLGRVLGWAFLPNVETGEPGLNLNQILVEKGLAEGFSAPEDQYDSED
jgi:hypothetical protein